MILLPFKRLARSRSLNLDLSETPHGSETVLMTQVRFLATLKLAQGTARQAATISLLDILLIRFDKTSGRVMSRSGLMLVS